jgi:hypothetical protein
VINYGSKTYFSDFSRWIANLGVVPLLLLRAFLFWPIFTFLLALLFLVTLVLETIIQLRYVFSISKLTKQATRRLRHNFINLEVLPTSHFLVKGLLSIVLSFHVTLASNNVKNTTFQQLTSANKSLGHTLTKGELIRVNFSGLTKFTVGNKEVLNVKSLENGDLLLKGVGLGFSDLLIWTRASSEPKKLEVFVIHKSQQLKIKQVLLQLKDLPLVHQIKGRSVHLFGELKDIENYHNLLAVYSRNLSLINISNVNLSVELSKKVYSSFLVKQSRYGLTKIKCSLKKIIIECETSKALAKKLKTLEKEFFISWQNEDLLTATRQYKVVFFLQQFENSKGEAFNFGLSKIDGQLSDILMKNPLALIDSNNIALNKENFKSETLAHPIIRGLLSQNIKVRLGQEIPFLQSVTNGVATQEWRFAGLSLDVILKPHSERLNVSYKTNLSTPGERGISKNLQESHLLIEKNQTVVLFDIGFKVNHNKKVGLPYLSEIPLFGSLFSGRAVNETYKKILCLIRIEEIK